MIDWVPIEYYTPIYYFVMLFVVVFTVLHCAALQFNDPKNKLYLQFIEMSIVLFVILYMGLRPISGVFTDMTTYAAMFRRSQDIFATVKFDGDLFFNMYIYFCAKTIDINSFFLLCTILYTLPLYFACKKWFGNYSFYIFLAIIISFSFWAYGTNGIRNGIAGSLLIFAFSREKLTNKILFSILAVGIHKSMLLPLFGYIIAVFYNKPKNYFYFWLLSIPLSLIGGGIFETLFAAIGFDDRLDYLTAEPNLSKFSSTGFRWDFLLYSSTAIFAGWYYFFIKKYNDNTYNLLFLTYTFSNAFWILVIRANFSNRFAYLSWFMIALIIFYPLIKKPEIFKSSNWIYAIMLIVYFAFTFFMNVIL